MGKNDKLKQFNPSATRKRQKSRENDWKSEWFFPNYFDAVLIDIKVMCILKNSDWYIFYGFGIETKVELQKWTIDNFNKFNRKNSCNECLFSFFLSFCSLDTKWPQNRWTQIHWPTSYIQGGIRERLFGRH